MNLYDPKKKSPTAVKAQKTAPEKKKEEKKKLKVKEVIVVKREDAGVMGVLLTILALAFYVDTKSRLRSLEDRVGSSQ